MIVWQTTFLCEQIHTIEPYQLHNMQHATYQLDNVAKTLLENHDSCDCFMDISFLLAQVRGPYHSSGNGNPHVGRLSFTLQVPIPVARDPNIDTITRSGLKTIQDPRSRSQLYDWLNLPSQSIRNLRLQILDGRIMRGMPPGEPVSCSPVRWSRQFGCGRPVW